MFRAIHSNGAFNASEIKQTILDENVQAKLTQLGDVELAILICLIAQEHCMFSTDQGLIRDLQDELEQICSTTFGLQPVVVRCSAKMTVDELNEAILVEPSQDGKGPNELIDGPQKPLLLPEFTSTERHSSSRFGSNTLDNRRIADVVIITNMDLASESVQVQALDLVRTKRVFTRTAMHTAVKDFMMLAITSTPGARFSPHLNDLYCMSHFHAEEDGLPYVDGDRSSDFIPNLTPYDVQDLRTLAEDARLTPEIAAYLHNIVVFMRNNRFIKGGVTATATRQLRAVSKTLAPLHGLDYVSPSLLSLAVRKIYPHRIKLATVENERSLQWGSDPDAVQELLKGVTVDDAIEDVLASVETPL